MPSGLNLYTLEDTVREVKIKGETAIWAGEYYVDWIKTVTPMTKRWRDRGDIGDWFEYFLEIKGVKDFSGVYFHALGTNKDTRGCIGSCQGQYREGNGDYSFDWLKSVEAMRLFYEEVGDILKSGRKVKLKIVDKF